MALKPEQVGPAQTLLKGLALFAGCTEDHIKTLSAGLESRDVLKGKVIIMEQEISQTLYLLAKGSVGIWRRERGQKVLVATLKAPDFFGETSMFVECPATALVKTEEDCQLFTLSRVNFDSAMQKYLAIGAIVHKHMEELETQRPALTKPVEGQEPTA